MKIEVVLTEAEIVQEIAEAVESRDLPGEVLLLERRWPFVPGWRARPILDSRAAPGRGVSSPPRLPGSSSHSVRPLTPSAWGRGTAPPTGCCSKPSSRPAAS